MNECHISVVSKGTVVERSVSTNIITCQVTILCSCKFSARRKSRGIKSAVLT